MNDKHIDELLDLKIKMSGHKMLEKLAGESPSEEELAGFCIPSKKLDSKVEKALKKAMLKKTAKKTLRIAVFAAALVTIVVGIGMITLSHTNALHIKFKEILLSDHVGYTDLQSTSVIDSKEESFIDNAKDYIAPGYLPDGFALVESTLTPSTINNCYLSRSNDEIRISKRFDSGSIAFDNEQSTHFETLIMGNKAVVQEHPDMNIIYYFSNNYFYMITGSYVSTDELIKIAESLPK